MALETITLAGGCFWCTEAVFTEIDGVESVVSGYANGHVERPTYEQVCGGATGHAEAVQVTFDPQRVGLRALLEVFFDTHDPTTPNRQGNDVGPQYRSGIYWSDPAQEGVVRDVAAEADRAHRGRVVTELAPLHVWWPAEDYHQRYFERNPGAGYCAFVVAPKVEKFRRRHAALRRRG